MLIYAVKANSRDIVNFLLHKGVDFKTANTNREALFSLALKDTYSDIASSIVQIKNASFREINNNLDSDMYKWAVAAKQKR